MKRKIVTDLKILNQKSELASFWEIRRIIKDLEDSLDLKKGVGLSANQIAIPVKIAIIRLSNCKIDLFNPKIIEKSKPFRFEKEGCLSIPGLLIDTKRYFNITIENGNGERYNLTGLEACVAQHEINHMDGKLIINKGIKWQKRK